MTSLNRAVLLSYSKGVATMIKRWMIVAGILFLLGNMLIILGLTRGRVWGESYLNPLKTMWTTEKEAVIRSFIYVPVIFGISILVVAIVTFAITLNHLIKTSQTK